MTLRRAIAAAAISLAALATSAVPASAQEINWVAMDFTAGSTTGGGTYGSLNYVEAYAPSGHGVKVTARWANGVLVSGWASTSAGIMCRYFNPDNLQPLIGNNYTSTFKIYGYLGTNGTTC